MPDRLTKLQNDLHVAALHGRGINEQLALDVLKDIAARVAAKDITAKDKKKAAEPSKSAQEPPIEDKPANARDVSALILRQPLRGSLRVPEDMWAAVQKATPLHTSMELMPFRAMQRLVQSQLAADVVETLLASHMMSKGGLHSSDALLGLQQCVWLHRSDLLEVLLRTPLNSGSSQRLVATFDGSGLAVDCKQVDDHDARGADVRAYDVSFAGTRQPAEVVQMLRERYGEVHDEVPVAVGLSPACPNVNRGKGAYKEEVGKLKMLRQQAQSEDNALLKAVVDKEKDKVEAEQLLQALEDQVDLAQGKCQVAKKEQQAAAQQERATGRVRREVDQVSFLALWWSRLVFGVGVIRREPCALGLVARVPDTDAVSAAVTLSSRGDVHLALAVVQRSVIVCSLHPQRRPLVDEQEQKSADKPAASTTHLSGVLASSLRPSLQRMLGLEAPPDDKVRSSRLAPRSMARCGAVTGRVREFELRIIAHNTDSTKLEIAKEELAAEENSLKAAQDALNLKRKAIKEARSFNPDVRQLRKIEGDISRAESACDAKHADLQVLQQWHSTRVVVPRQTAAVLIGEAEVRRMHLHMTRDGIQCGLAVDASGRGLEVTDKVSEGGAAHIAGLRPGDLITAVSVSGAATAAPKKMPAQRIASLLLPADTSLHHFLTFNGDKLEFGSQRRMSEGAFVELYLKHCEIYELKSIFAFTDTSKEIKMESSKAEASKAEASRAESSKPEASKPEASKVSVAEISAGRPSQLPRSSAGRELWAEALASKELCIKTFKMVGSSAPVEGALQAFRSSVEDLLQTTALDVCKVTAARALGGEEKVASLERTALDTRLTELSQAVFSVNEEAHDWELRLRHHKKTWAWLPGGWVVNASSDAATCDIMDALKLSAWRTDQQEQVKYMSGMLNKMGQKLAKLHKPDRPHGWEICVQHAADEMSLGALSSWVIEAGMPPPKREQSPRDAELLVRLRRTHRVDLDNGGRVWRFKGGEEASQELERMEAAHAQRQGMWREFANANATLPIVVQRQEAEADALKLWRELCNDIVQQRESHLSHLKERRFAAAEQTLASIASTVNRQITRLLSACQADLAALDARLAEAVPDMNKMEHQHNKDVENMRLVWRNRKQQLADRLQQAESELAKARTRFSEAQDKKESKIKASTKERWEQLRADIDKEFGMAQVLKEEAADRVNQIDAIMKREEAVSTSQVDQRHAKWKSVQQAQRRAEQSTRAAQQRLATLTSSAHESLTVLAAQHDAHEAFSAMLKNTVTTRFICGCQLAGEVDHASRGDDMEEVHSEEEQDHPEAASLEEVVEEGDAKEMTAEEEYEEKRKRVVKAVKERQRQQASASSTSVLSEMVSSASEKVSSAVSSAGQAMRRLVSGAADAEQEATVAHVEIVIERRSPVRLAIERCDTASLRALLHAHGSIDAFWHEAPDVRHAMAQAWRRALAAADNDKAEFARQVEILEILWQHMPPDTITSWAMGSRSLAEVEAAWVAHEQKPEKAKASKENHGMSFEGASGIGAVHRAGVKRKRPLRTDDGSLHELLKQMLGQESLDVLTLRISECLGASSTLSYSDAFAALAGKRGTGSLMVETVTELHNLLAMISELTPLNPPSPLLIILRLTMPSARLTTARPRAQELRRLLVAKIAGEACMAEYAPPLRACRPQARSLTPLHIAASLGDVEAVSAFLLAGYTPLASTKFTQASALAHAVVCGSENCLSALVDAGPLDRESREAALTPLLLAAAELSGATSTSINWLSPVLQKLVSLGANPSACNMSGLSPLTLIVRHGLPWIALAHLGSCAESNVAAASWCSAVNALASTSPAEIFAPHSSDGYSCCHLLLAFCPWTVWPTSLQQSLCHRLKRKDEGEMWVGSALHAFAMVNSTSEAPIVDLLLQKRANPDAKWPTSGRFCGQSALHLAAACGLYEWDESASRPSLVHPLQASALQASSCQLVGTLLQARANPLSRDARGNLAAHLACAVEHMDIVKALEEHHGLQIFEGAYPNKRNMRPAGLCSPDGSVAAYLASARRKAAEKAKAAEDRLRAMGGAKTSIDFMLSPNLGAAALLSLAPGYRISQVGVEQTPQEQATQKADGAAPTAVPDQEGVLSPARGHTSGGGTHGPAEPTPDSPPVTLRAHTEATERGLKLVSELCFGSQPVQLAVTRHVLQQLALLDDRRRRTAVRTLHRLATGQGHTASLRLPADRDEPLWVCHLDKAMSGEKAAVYVVWERSSSSQPFFEAGTTDAIRVWSVETSTNHVEDVGTYIERAWEFGRLAGGESSSFPMGTTNELSDPGKQWHPMHTDDAGELAVPYIIKWYAVSDTFARLLLCPSYVLGKGTMVDLSQENFQLPLLLDQTEQQLAAPSTASSTLLVGRSGTGKTSIAMEILFRLQEANRARSDELRKRQRDSTQSPNSTGATGEDVGDDTDGLPPHTNAIFVCKSKTLVCRVEAHFEQLMLPLGGQPAGSTDRMRQAFVQPKGELETPLFLSSSEWLVLLDRCAEQRWFQSEREEASFVSAMNGTVDSLASLLEQADDQEADAGTGDDAVDMLVVRRRAKRKTETPQKLLTFEIFSALFQQHKLLKVLSISSIYREIFRCATASSVLLCVAAVCLLPLATSSYCTPPAGAHYCVPTTSHARSYIKGSREAMHTDKGFLSREAYFDMSSKLSPLPPEMRSYAYDAFEEYLKRKRKHNLYDLCDVVFHLFWQKKRHVRISKAVIDEVQDLTMAEIALLHSVTDNEDGFFICGDTAQTISRGVGFRFTDVRLLFGGRPTLQQLLINYRTHAGILGTANAIVGLLLQLFPNTLDRLRNEHGHFSGPPPALLPDTSPQRVAELMLSADDLGVMEMGANQVVIVRSHEAKSALPLVLQSGLVLTVEESKGLEFDDVCVYNFFMDSPKECMWLVINSLQEADAKAEADQLAWQEGTRLTAVEFDSTRHQLLCEELKAFYVAVTRARKRCFVFDASVERRSPMFRFLHRQGVAEDGLEKLLSVVATKVGKSTADDWLRQGDNLYANKLWAPAEKCYLKGGDEVKALTAGAKRLVVQAQEAPKGAKAEAYHRAATAFMHCAARQQGVERDTSLVHAARVWWFYAGSRDVASHEVSSHCYSEAGLVLRDGLSSPRHRDAVVCFVSAAEHCPRDPDGWRLALQTLKAGRQASVDAQRRLRFLVESAATAQAEQLFLQMAPVLDEFPAASIDWGVQ